MTENSLKDKAWENFCKARGWARYWGKHGRFDLFISLKPENIGKPYPLSAAYCSNPLAYLSAYTAGDENNRGWSILERSAAVGVYLGRKMVYEGRKGTKMIFATPTQKDHYMIYTSSSGIVNWFGGGDDEPCEQSGIRVDPLFVTNSQNTKAIEQRFGEKFRDLGLLVRELSHC